MVPETLDFSGAPRLEGKYDKEHLV